MAFLVCCEAHYDLQGKLNQLATVVVGSLTGIIFFCILFFPFSSNAAAAVKQQGITLSPFQQEVLIQANDSDKTFDLTLTNNTSSLQELSLSSRDFGSLNDTGGVLLEGSKDYSQKFGLVSWLVLGTDTVIIQPGESQKVPITIQNRTSLRPGGHYGAIVASVTSLDGQNDKEVIINQQLLSLIFAKKIGGERYDLKLKEISHNGNWLHLPDTITLRFQNPGNVHVIPRGIVKLKSPSGKVVSQGIINSESAFTLPGSYRELFVPLNKVASNVSLPGPYRIEVEYRYDGLDRSTKKAALLSFVSLPSYVILALLLGAGFYIFRRIRRVRKITAQQG